MTHEEIKHWLDKHGIEHYTIRPDSIVDVTGHVNIRDLNEPSFPFQFGKVTGTFDCNYGNITSLIGAPESVGVGCAGIYTGGGFSCHSTMVSSLQGAPQYVNGSFSCYGTNIISLTGVDKIIKQINGRFLCSADVTHLLGLLLIKGITSFNIDAHGPIDKIFNKYVGTGDILSAQDELIDAGFIDQARL